MGKDKEGSLFRKQNHNKVVHAQTIKALRHRRDTAYQHVEGPEHDGRLPLSIKLAYTAPTMSTLPIVLLLAVYMNVFYEKLGAPLAYISLFIAMARSLDVITDPVMSFVTDACRSKHGRRRPFIATGCIPYGVFLALLCSPPAGMSPLGTACWFGVFYILYFLMNTYSNIPYDALGPEMTDNYEDRSRLFFISGLFDGFGSLLTITTPVGLAMLLQFRSTTKYDTCVPSTNSELIDDMWVTLDTGSCADMQVGGVKKFPLPGFGREMLLPNVTTLFNETACLGDMDTDYTLIGNATRVFCECRDQCLTAWQFASEKDAFMMVGIFFALWYITTCFICVTTIKERCQVEGGASLPAPPPMIPSMLNTFNNYPFVCLLPAWACDAVTNGIIASMVPYFVRYVVVPEYQPGCDNGLNTKWTCQSMPIVGAAVTCTLLAAFAFTPMWLWLTKSLGKRKAWLIWSVSMATTNIMFMFVGEGNYQACIAVSMLNGIPFGAKFLADAILADIIDYDEFITGQRSEATYTMFKSFLPKICAIPAAAVPLALLNVFGHVAPVHGRIQHQPAGIATYCKVVTVIIPTLFSILAFLLKLKFPLKTKEQCDHVSEGIAKHMMGKPAREPLSGISFSLTEFDNDDQQQLAYLLDNFPGVKVIEQMKVAEDRTKQLLKSTCIRQIATGAVTMVATMSAVILTIVVRMPADWCQV